MVTPESARKPLAKGTFSTPDDAFNVYFHFRNGGLAGVRLDAQKPQRAGVIFNDLKLTYGPPSGDVLDRKQFEGGCLAVDHGKEKRPC